MADIVDALQIKIEQAKGKMPEEALNAIAAVDWRATIIQLREKKGYTFEQLGNLELETELLLCGLILPENYSRELEKRMQISKSQVNELVNEMNTSVFEKIKEELIKNSERKKVFAKTGGVPTNTMKEKEGIPISVVRNKTDLNELHPLLTQKMSGAFKIPIVKTEHTLDNISKTTNPTPPPSPPPKKADPYRLSPDE